MRDVAETGPARGAPDGGAPPLDLRTKLFYGLGSTAFGVKDNGFTTLLLLFYNQVIGLPAQWVGGAIMIALAFDAFLDPLVGQISDHLRSSWGRRHPFMYASALPVALSYLLLWNPPHGWSQPALFGYLVAVAVVVRTFITFYEIPSSALAPELTTDYDQRTSLMSYRLFFAWFGGLAMIVLAFRVFLVPDAAHPVGQLNPAGYSRYGLTAAIVMFCVIVVSAAGTHGRIRTFRPPPPPPTRLSALLKEMAATLSHRSFLMLTASSLFSYTATGVVFALSVYFNTYFWGLSAAQISGLLLSGIVSAWLAFFVALPLSKRFGKKPAMLALFASSLAIGCAPIGLRLLGVFPANGSPLVFPLLLGFQVVALTLSVACQILAASMIADVVEDSQVRTGRRSEGLFFAANSFIQKTVSGVGIGLAGLILGLVHFPAGVAPGQVDPAILRNLALVYLPVMLTLYGVAMLFVSQYRITREGHEESLRRLAAEAEEAGTPPL